MNNHNCEYVDLSRDSVLCNIIKKNCEKCLARIFSIRMRVLFKKDRNKEDFLYKCVKYDNSNFLKIFLRSDCYRIFQLSSNNLNIKGKTILHESIINLNKSSYENTDSDQQKIECLEVLLTECNNLNYNGDFYMHIIMSDVIDSRKILKYLKMIIDNNLMDPHKKDFNNNTLLHEFFKREWTSSYVFSNSSHIYTIELLTYLMSLGIDLDAKNSHGDTILKMCIRSPGNEEFLKVLLLGGIKINYLFEDPIFVSYAPIHHIIFKDNYKYMEILLLYRSDVDINIKSSKILHTPLHSACCSDMPNARKIIELLINRGCSIDERCSAGLLPEDYAKWYGLLDIYECVVKFKLDECTEYTDCAECINIPTPHDYTEIEVYEEKSYDTPKSYNYEDYKLDFEYISKDDIPDIDEYCREDFSNCDFIIPDEDLYFPDIY